MKPSVRRTSETKVKSKEKPKEEPPNSRKQDEKTKKSSYSSSTPRSYLQKSSTSDIYSQKKAPKKTGTSIGNSISPMKGLLKSSPSSVGQVSRSSSRDDRLKTKRITEDEKRKERIVEEKRRERTAKDLPIVNVTVNSPAAKRKLNLNNEISNENVKIKDKEVGDRKEKDFKVVERQRTKTRTLAEDEVKMLTPGVVDNNAEMMNLSRKLAAKPKAFYVDLDGDQSKHQEQKGKSSDEDVSYEDDFESYESDFDSYHSEQSQSEHSASEANEQSSEEQCEHTVPENNLKEVRDEERMLDSGSFDLRESQRSANKVKPAIMDFILEDAEDTRDEKKTSLTDEGFQEMSSSSSGSSMKIVQMETLERPFFIDFTKANEYKRKRRINDKIKQRAKDILSMISLHEMSYTLFEMKPIPYDLYMATFGRNNYTQSAVQTFDDGITEEVQTEDISYDLKWTQHPIEFSKHDIYLNTERNTRKYTKNEGDHLTKFTFLLNQNTDVEKNNEINLAKDYKENPLRIYFEQKDGVGSALMLPYNDYQLKLKNTTFNVDRLKKFLKKTESKISHILNMNIGKTEFSDLIRNSKLPFSKGYVSISPQSIKDGKFKSLKHAKISNMVFSENKNNLIMTVHKKSSSFAERCVACLWDTSVATQEPIKILIIVDDVRICRFRGNTDGIFVAALEDGSIHLWDLTEEATWREDVASENKTKLVEVNSEDLTQVERDRVWNLKNRHVGLENSSIQFALQSCAYTSSGTSVSTDDVADCTIGLVFGGVHGEVSQEGGRKVIGQICSLQRAGVLTLWNIVQDKTCLDIGKAFWSKMKLEKCQTVNLMENIDLPIKNTTEDALSVSNFNLNAAKRRMLNRKQEKNIVREVSRPKSAINRPASAVRSKKLPAVKNASGSWESGIVCYDLKVMKYNKTDRYLVAKNCGEILCCTRNAGAVKVDRFCVATDTSTVSCVEVSSHGLPYFLAATDSGTIHLYSIPDARVLLTLDCRNGPPAAETAEKYQSDSKGRYINSRTVRNIQTAGDSWIVTKMSVLSVLWSRANPCCIFTLTQDGALGVWDLTHSDIYARSICEHAAVACDAGDAVIALLTSEGEVQVHRLSDERDGDNLLLFQKYVALL